MTHPHFYLIIKGDGLGKVSFELDKKTPEDECDLLQ